MRMNTFYLLMICMLHAVYSCSPTQVERWSGSSKICCNPAICRPGQQFLLCEENDGFDTCQNCPTGTGHKDWINTTNWEYKTEICLELEDCSVFVDLREENSECVCDRTRGYFGLDRNKCSVDRNHQCRKPGYQLTQTGECVICGDGYFKEKEDYSLCVEKTRCESDQEIDNPGSHLKDRTCRKVVKNIPQPTIRNVTTGINGHGSKKNFTTHNDDLNNNGGHNNITNTKDVDGINDSNTDFDHDSVPKTSAESNMTLDILVAVVITVVTAFFVVALLWYRHQKKKLISKDAGETRYDNQENRFNCFCCPNTYQTVSYHETNVKGDNVIVGEKAKMFISSSGENLEQASDETDHNV